jgi:hypothetical protein
VLKAAVPVESSVSVPNAVLPSKKVTPPMGGPLALETFAVSVSTAPAITLEGEEVSVAIVAMAETVTGIAGETLGRKALVLDGV